MVESALQVFNDDHFIVGIPNGDKVQTIPQITLPAADGGKVELILGRQFTFSEG